MDFGDLVMNVENIVRLLLACLCGGLIGYEREQHANRPAGFRTHILVCVGSALVMTTSEFIFFKYGETLNVDPARLGAQVISGIGFLGAGTIIRQGATVKGLTTAASLWAVACVGIACGIGFYPGAIFATIIIYMTLLSLKAMEARMVNQGEQAVLIFEVDKSIHILGRISEMLALYDAKIKDIKINDVFETKTQMIRFDMRLSKKSKLCYLLEELNKIEGVIKIEVEDS